tara:strand:+ start:561 stop:992 length:432 start_codon:yes stop_codon:yes gene_type:complete
MPTASLSPIGIITAQLGDQIELGEGPKGRRLISDVISLEFKSDKINASLATNDAADWLTISNNGKLGSLDVRFTLATEDGAFIYVEYSGRADMESGLIATAPTFQTSHEKYLWMNNIQAVAAGQIDEQGKLIYNLYQVDVFAD